MKKGKIHLVDVEISTRLWKHAVCRTSRPKQLTEDQSRVTCTRCLAAIAARLAGGHDAS